MTMGELTAGCHDSGAAALTHSGGEMLILEYFLELLYAGGRRTFELSPGILIEGDEINFGPKTS